MECVHVNLLFYPVDLDWSLKSNIKKIYYTKKVISENIFEIIDQL